MKRSNMARALGTQSAPNLGYSRIPSVSRAISAICHRHRDSPLQVEFVGGSTRWRFVEDDFNESESDSQPKTRRVRPSNTSASRSSSQACLHEVTIAAGWGQKSEREKRMEKLTSKLGYTPGLPRQRGGESRLDSFLPAEYRAGAFDFKAPVAPKPRSTYSGDVKLETRQNLRILKMPPDGDRLVVKRWTAGFFEASSRQLEPGW